ncbi:hypothetical protein [Brassicibacter mesophilus]|uniref:hypothetical protein n=1 Tax=Brassicibacter mesophilus TaxID=745119 RepID=UPI003D218F89
MSKEFGNFDHIKKQMIEQKKRAEETKPTLEKEAQDTKDNQQPEEVFTISITPPSEKVEKKAVNFYLSKSLIKRIKRGAKQYNKRDSIFLEEVMDQVLQSMGL